MPIWTTYLYFNYFTIQLEPDSNRLLLIVLNRPLMPKRTAWAAENVLGTWPQKLFNFLATTKGSAEATVELWLRDWADIKTLGQVPFERQIKIVQSARPPLTPSSSYQPHVVPSSTLLGWASSAIKLLEANGTCLSSISAAVQAFCHHWLGFHLWWGDATISVLRKRKKERNRQYERRRPKIMIIIEFNCRTNLLGVKLLRMKIYEL